jgi:hypothetical protein
MSQQCPTLPVPARGLRGQALKLLPIDSMVQYRSAVVTLQQMGYSLYEIRRELGHLIGHRRLQRLPAN